MFPITEQENIYTFAYNGLKYSDAKVIIVRGYARE